MSKVRRKIVVDFDNNLADSIDAIVKAFNTVDCTDYGDSKSIRKWNMTDLIPRADDKSIEQMFNSHLFWNNLKFKIQKWDLKEDINNQK